jgi:hypothetical protein
MSQQADGCRDLQVYRTMAERLFAGAPFRRSMHASGITVTRSKQLDLDQGERNPDGYPSKHILMAAPDGSTLMELGKDTERFGKGTALRGWALVFLAFLLTISTILHVVPSTSAQAQPALLHAESWNNESDPCAPGHSSILDHCKTTSVCPFCMVVAPMGTAFPPRATHPFMIVAILAWAEMNPPHFRPPMPGSGT